MPGDRRAGLVARPARQTARFQHAATTAGLVLTILAAALAGWAMLRTRDAAEPAPAR
ncbi:hypothetical protein [Actinoplanes siamensis]|uniref:hypothetical protein n=1 Tax=Actinoplanes siamensis TaxID=1223317 RepID=UPI001943CBC9|nr:hypothetical protein [Actinoplanes siamensis]